MDDWFGGDFLKTNIHQHRASHLPALSLREGGGQQYLAQKEFESMWRKTVSKRLFIRLLLQYVYCNKSIAIILLITFYCKILIAKFLVR